MPASPSDLKRVIENPFVEKDYEAVLGMDQLVDVAEANPKIFEIARNIYLRQDRSETGYRSLSTVVQNVLSGFGAEYAFRQIVPSATIKNESVIDIAETSYEDLQTDVVYRGHGIAIKTSIENDTKNERLWWISRRQRESIVASAPFNDYLLVLGCRPTDRNDPECTAFRYRSKLLLNIKRLASNFDYWAKTAGADSPSFLLDVDKGIEKGMCLDFGIKRSLQETFSV